MRVLKNGEYLSAFFVSVIIALVGFAAAGVYPFGEYAAVCSDMEQQFLDLTAGLFNNIKSGKGIFVTYSGGMGVNLLAWSAYLLYDPLNILFLFFDVEYYQEVYLVIDILKYGIIALCASVFLKKSNYTALSGKFNIALAVLYAFGSFCLKSMINVMWLGNVAALPIVMLAIERVIEKKKTGLLFFSFLYCTASNFYLAFATGLFCLMYFVFYYINVSGQKDVKDVLKSVVLCGVSVALVGGLCMAFIIPAWTNISGAYDEMFEDNIIGKFIEWKPVYIAMFLTLIQPNAAVDNVIHGFFGIVPLFLVILFFFGTSIGKKEKISAFVWILIMLLSLMLRPLYLVWHLFREPTCFYGRFVYVIAFLFIMLAARFLKNIALKTRKLLAVPALAVFLTAFYAVSGNVNYAVLINVCVVALFLFVYVLVFAAYIKKKGGKAGAAAVAVIIAEALIMSVYGFHVSRANDNWVKRSVFYDDVKKIDRLLDNIDDNGFYRITNINRRSLNAALTSGYNATEVFSSFTNQRSLKGLAMLGLYCPYDYRNLDNFFNTTVTDSLLANKYAIVTHKDEIYTDSANREIPAFIGSYSGAFRLTSPVYKKIAETDDGIIYENTAAFPLMFACSEKAVDADTRYTKMTDSLLGSYISTGELLNSLFDMHEELYTKCMPTLKETIHAEVLPTDDEDFMVLHPVNIPEGQLYANEGDEVGIAMYEYDVDEDAEFCIDIREIYNKADNMQMRYHTNINGFNVMTYHMPNCQFETSDIGFFKKGDTIRMNIETQRDLEMTKPVMAKLDSKAFEKFSAAANENALENITGEGSDITAVSDFDEDKLVFMSLSYDEGFHIYIDGEETEKVRIADTFMGCRIPAGKHEIRVKYISPGFETGMIVFAVSAVLSCLWLLLNAKKRSAQTAEE